MKTGKLAALRPKMAGSLGFVSLILSDRVNDDVAKLYRFNVKIPFSLFHSFEEEQKKWFV